MDRTIKHCLRRCWGLPYRGLHEYHISGKVLRKAAGWPSTTHMIMRASLIWLGHVARMSVHRRPKQVLFGWWKGRTMKAHAWIGQSRWLERCLAQAGIVSEDWFRLAQNRKEWRKRIIQALPERVLTPQDRSSLDSWRPGLPMPDHSPTAPVLPAPQEEVPGRFKCWVCSMSFEHGNTRQVHYEKFHAVCSPALTTTRAFQCEHCLVWFPKLDRRTHHECPAREPLERVAHVVNTGDPPLEAPGKDKVPEYRHVYTDGSGAHGKAGWAAVVFDEPPGRQACCC